MARIIIGVMGPGDHARPDDVEAAFELGKLIASKGWVLLTGGRKAGVMQAASRGAKEGKGLTVGILPAESDGDISEYVDIPVLTGMGSARNNINVLSSRVVVSCGMGPGTASETALAIKSGKPVILLNSSTENRTFFRQFSPENLYSASSPSEAVDLIESLLTDA